MPRRVPLPRRIAAGIGGAFSPAQFSNTRLWWRGDLGVTLESGKVSSWRDQIIGATADQSTATARPTYVASTTVFKQAGLSFDGSDELEVTNAAAKDVFRNLHTGITNITVIEDIQSSGTNYITYVSVDNGTSGRANQIISPTRKLQGFDRVNNDATNANLNPAPSSFALGDDFAFIHFRDFSGRGATFKNDTSIVNNNSIFSGVGYEDSTPLKFFIGSADNQFFLTATICEIIHIEDISIAELNELFVPYLNDRYGLGMGNLV